MWCGMDEGLLNDLLECSVCLERLDTSSRVLPCQHTFCLKCLKVIVESHKELRCPECRVLVEAKVEELPPNVLLMRILEGMRGSAPRRAPAAALRTHRAPHQHQTLPQQSAHTTGTRSGDGKQLPPHARAMYDYISKEPGDLSFKKGESILLHKRLDPFWYQGECSGRTGMFPITFVKVVVPLPIPTALCKALYDFRMSAPDEEGCLAFDKGAIITVHRRVDENWAEGRIEERVGIFPIAFVELNQAARQLMSSPALNRPVPPVPDHPRPGHSDHRHHAQHSHRYQPMSMSTPASVPGNYQNVATMSQSHPNYHQHAPPMLAPQQQSVATMSQSHTNNHQHAPPMLAPQQILVPQPVGQHAVGHGLVTTTAVPRNILEPTQTKHMDMIHFTNAHNKSAHQTTMGLQSVSRINDGFERLRTVKYDTYNSTPVHKAETTYQNVRAPVSVANFNTNNSSDSSSTNTPSVGVSSTTTPNTSSNTSSCESAEPSLPSSPDNAERNATVTPSQKATEEPTEAEVNTSMGVLSLNESSTATNTSLNVSLPPTESSVSANDSQECASKSEPSRLDTPCSSKSQNPPRSSGPDSLLNFGLGLQAALSPSHAKDGNYMNRAHREHNHREKRHSLTPSSHLNANHASQNRHSAEILATSLLDHTPERDRERPASERDKERRRRRSRSNERPLPATYIALYPYRPQKPDELELKKGATYTVTERCRDGWYKGCSERTQRCGVFPGNYVAPKAAVKQEKVVTQSPAVARPAQVAAPAPSGGATLAPLAPPRAASPQPNAQTIGYPWNAVGPGTQLGTPKSDKPSRDKSKGDKSVSTGVSLMKRLAGMKKCRSPPPGYSMDNPVFEDTPHTSLHHPVHVRSGSCPVQLLGALATPERGTASARLRARPRPTVLPAPTDSRPSDNPWQAQHRKSQSLDVTAARRDRHHSQPIKERFRCIVPYPPNSEYELELKVDDIVMVHRKRGDGWYKGTLQRTGRTGLFPASFVQSAPQE